MLARSIKSVSLLLFIAACAAETDAGVEATQPIVGGTTVNILDFPWQVGLVKAGTLGCGGTILGKRWVLTAGHCVEGHTATEFKVAAGITNKNQVGVSGQLVGVAAIHLAPGWTGVAKDGNDAALLQLSSDLNLASPAIQAIAMVSPKDHELGVDGLVTYATVSGWGSIGGPYLDQTDVLHAITVPLISTTHAQALLDKAYPPPVPRLLDTQLTTQSYSTTSTMYGYKGPCFGDSGGPLVVPSLGGREPMLAGIVSFGADCFYGTSPSVFTRVSAYHDWIKATMGCSSARGGDTFCSASCLCGAGQGDCDSNAQCGEGKTCQTRGGSSFAQPSATDVCDVPAHVGANGSSTFCSQAHPCKMGEGQCDANNECLPGLVCKKDKGATYGFASTVDVCGKICTDAKRGDETFCSPGCPCSTGEGDCDTDADCVGGLTCVQDIGASYGMAPTVDVCVKPCGSACGGRAAGASWADSFCSYRCSFDCKIAIDYCRGM